MKERKKERMRKLSILMILAIDTVVRVREHV